MPGANRYRLRRDKMSLDIVATLQSDLLGGTAEVLPIRDASSRQLLRCLLRSEASSAILDKHPAGRSDAVFTSQHIQMATELVSKDYCGAFSFEVPLPVLIGNIDLYRSMAFVLLKNEISLKFHVVLTSDMPDYEQSFLLAELGEIVALGVDLVIDNVTSSDDIAVASMIISVIDEIRMDISHRNATSYIHLSALISSGVAKKPKIGVIIADGQELPEFCVTYQMSSNTSLN